MTDDKKTNRWTKTLHKAGLIGNVDDGWTLPEDALEENPVIVVVSQKDTEPPSAPADDSEDSPTTKPIYKSKDAASAFRSSDSEPPADASVSDLLRMMNERFDMGDYSGALETADQILEIYPDDRDSSFMRLQCRKALMQMYESRIGSFRRIPKRIVSEEEIIWRNLDPVAGFIAASVDGSVSFEDIIDISTLSRFDACRVLNQLLQDGIIQ